MERRYSGVVVLAASRTFPRHRLWVDDARKPSSTKWGSRPVPRTVLSVPRLAASVSKLRRLLDDQLSAFAVSQQCREDLAILITEASTNAVRHGHGGDAFEVAIAVDQ